MYIRKEIFVMSQDNDKDILKNTGDADTEGTHQPAEKKHRGHFVRNTAIAASAVLVSAYIGGAVYFSSHFLPNTNIEGADCSCMSVEEAETGLKEKTDARETSVRFRGGFNGKIRGCDIELSYVDKDAYTRTLSSQNIYTWPYAFFRRTDVDIKDSYTYNNDKLKAVLSGFDPMNDDNMEKPEDAYISFSEDEGRFIIVHEKEGTVIDKEKALSSVGEAVVSGKTDVDLDSIDGMYSKPSVRSDSEELAEKVNELNTAVAGGITYSLPDGETMSVDADMLREWISEDEDGYYIDEDVWRDKAVEFVDSLAARCNSVWETREFDSTEDGTISVPGGTYGYVVDKEEEIDAVMSLIDSAENEERQPYYSSSESSDRSNHGFGGTYIEVSIDRQHLWYYENGELIMDSPVVTGNAGRSETPKGQYRVQFTQRDAVLIGRPDANGNPSYRSPVDYWMPFYDGCGFHDASWRGSFGGDIYKYNGSHGCVNMPPSSARELFGYIEGKTPVVVIY